MSDYRDKGCTSLRGGGGGGGEGRVEGVRLKKRKETTWRLYSASILPRVATRSCTTTSQNGTIEHVGLPSKQKLFKRPPAPPPPSSSHPPLPSPSPPSLHLLPSTTSCNSRPDPLSPSTLPPPPPPPLLPSTPHHAYTVPPSPPPPHSLA